MSKRWANWARTLSIFLLGGVLCTGTALAQASDPLPSCNDSTAKKLIATFVAKVTKEGGPDYVPIPERIAVFDNDGTLWSEQPMYVQMVFALDRVKALAPQHPEWAIQSRSRRRYENTVRWWRRSGSSS
jgi:hypothetical protein